MLEILFEIFRNADMIFLERKLICNFYTTTKVLLTTKQIELFNKKEFAKAALYAKSKTFLVYIAVLEASKILIHLLQKA